MIHRLMDFNPEIALRYARALSRPRRVGSGEDERVADEISAMLEGFGYRVERQPFTFSNFVNIAITLELGLSLSLIALGLRIDRFASWAALILLTTFVLFSRLNRLAEAASIKTSDVFFKTSEVWRRYRTANIVAHRPNLSADLPRLYLVAHYDSKSQRLPIVVRVLLFVIFITFSLSFVVWALVSIFMPIPQWPLTLSGLIALFAGFPLLLFTIEAGNESAGAIDNASGMGLVLHLAQCLARRDDIRLTILITSAEEWAALGAAAYVRKHESDLRWQADTGKLCLLNFDGVGVDGDLYYSDSHVQFPGALLDLVQEACAELNLPLKKLSLVGALFDHLPFAQRGFDAISLITIGKATLAVHTAGDTADKLHVRGFEQAGRVALRVVEKLVSPD